MDKSNLLPNLEFVECVVNRETTSVLFKKWTEFVTRTDHFLKKKLQDEKL